ncbi:MAG TPA: proline--tRNA ligase [Candidatus Dormibacteraeota bacterium]|nr:proline--tRNA ligase [Candidatus Dormibacteraeota bacterium]
MRLSTLFGRTLRATPADSEVAGHQLLLRAGYVRQLAAGVFSALPLGLRVARRIETILREEMDAVGGQECLFPVVHPAEIWQQSGRWYTVGPELVRFQDRGGRGMVIAMTHEEVVAEIARREISSYRQLPQLVYQIQTKFRDEPRPRAGLIRTREFTMKDAYTLDADLAGLQRQYARLYTAYFRVFTRCGLRDLIAVRADSGMMGGSVSHEFMFLNEIGEDTLALCERCGLADNLQVARFGKPQAADEPAQPLERVETPGCATIADLAAFLGVEPERTAKAVFFQASVPEVGTNDPSAVRVVLVMAIVRGDMAVNETKLTNALRARWLRPAEAEQIRAVGAEPGYASPVGIRREGVVVAVDDLVLRSPNLVAGANLPGVHWRNVNAGRDYAADVATDLVAAVEGAPCPRCGAPLHLRRGVEVGNIFQLGTHYSEALGATFVDEAGKTRPIVMGSYGIGVGRLLASLAEAHRDERGLCWPVAVAPFLVHLVRLGGAQAEVEALAEAAVAQLAAAGIEVLDDDRDVAAGVKFTDADLMGLPLRLTCSPRSLRQGGVELRRRDTGTDQVVGPGELVGAVVALRTALEAEAAAQVRSPAYDPAGDAA